MPFYVQDFRLDTLDLTNGQVGVYVVLLMLAWSRDDAALPNDMAWLKRSLKSCFANFHGHTFNRIVPYILTRYFVLGHDQKWRNKRLTLEREKAAKLSANARQNSNKRWHGIKHFNGLPHAEAMLLQSHIEESSLESQSPSAPKESASKQAIAVSSTLEQLVRRKGWV